MQTPGTPLSQSIESVATSIFYGKLPDGGSSLELHDSANLQELREEAYRANSSRAMDTRRQRVVAWSVGRAALDADTDNPSTFRLEAVLRMPYLLNQFVTPATLDIREFVEPELSEEERYARLAEHPRAIAGMYTHYRTNPAMTKLVVRQGLLTIDPLTNRGIPSSHTFGMQFDQPADEHVPKFLLMMHTDRIVADIDAGKIGNLLVPTEEQAAAFEHELQRGASGKHTSLPPIRAW